MNAESGAKAELRLIPLGGLGEIGMNMLVVEYGDSIMVVDCGLMFPEDYMLGIDIVIPDVSYLIKNRDKVKAFVITHGHEDHTGALPFVLREINAPVYGTALTLGLIENKLREFNLLDEVELKRVRPRETVSIGPFDVEFIRVSHSIVDGVGLAITTPLGVVVHTGDFKMDQTPVDGEVIDYARFSGYGEKGVLCLLSDSTNVESEGYTISEKEVGVAFEEIFRTASKRIFVATFSSNIHRIQQVMDVAAKFGRRVVPNGRSMLANIRIARKLGYLKTSDGLLAELKDLPSIPPQRCVILTTGSQGEPMSALTRIARGSHKQIKIEPNDTVVLSSKFIPGHEKAIANMMNHLFRRGADVVYEKVSEIHVSGHASQEELKIMFNMVRPKYFIPVHGEYRHLVRHGRLAEKLGLPAENVFVAEDGDVVAFTKDGAMKKERIESGKVLVDGKGVGDVSDLVLKDRMHLGNDGVVFAFVALNEQTGETIYGPEIVTRGLVLEQESAGLLDGAKSVVMETLSSASIETRTDTLELTEEIKRSLRRFFNKALERRPVILPFIIEI